MCKQGVCNFYTKEFEQWLSEFKRIHLEAVGERSMYLTCSAGAKDLLFDGRYYIMPRGMKKVREEQEEHETKDFANRPYLGDTNVIKWSGRMPADRNGFEPDEYSGNH